MVMVMVMVTELPCWILGCFGVRGLSDGMGCDVIVVKGWGRRKGRHVDIAAHSKVPSTDR